MKSEGSRSVGFVGLGHMGGNMAMRLLGAGYEVRGEALSREAVQNLVEHGLTWCRTPREVAQDSEFVFTSLPDDDALEAAASGPDGIIAGLSAGQVWAEMSTVRPRKSRSVATRVAARGASMLDAPLSGSVPQVQSGTLTIIVGGHEDAYRRVEPVLRELGSPTRVGDNGQGLAVKLAINISLAAQMLAFSEGLLLATREGVDAPLAARVMADSTIGSPMLRARVPLVLDPDADPWFDVRLMHKDIRLALELGRDLRVPLPSATAADEALIHATELGFEQRDIAALYEVLAQMGGEGERANSRGTPS